MALRIMPLSWNLVGTPTTAAAAFHVGYPASNITNADPVKVALGRGHWEITAAKQDLDVDEGIGEITAQIATGSHHGPGTLATATAAALNAVGTNWQVYQIQAGTNRGHWVLERTSGTASLLCNTGSSSNDAWAQLGFSTEYDRAAAASHTSDFPAIHGTTGQWVEWDLTTAQSAECAALIKPVAGPGLVSVIQFGTTTAVSDASENFQDYDTEQQAVFFDSPREYRYVRLDLRNPRNRKGSAIGAGYFYLGRYWEPGKVYEWSSKAKAGQMEVQSQAGLLGAPFLAELRPQERFTVSFGSAPGLTDADALALMDLLDGLGTMDYAIVSFDQTRGRINSETRLCELMQLPPFPHVYTQGPLGRWQGITLEFSTVAVI